MRVAITNTEIVEFEFNRNKKLSNWNKLFYLGAEMNEFTEVTAETLELLRGSRGMRQQEIADLLDIPQSAVSKIEKGSRSLSSSEKSLLDWYFFGKLPPRLTATLDLKGTLEFSVEEWHLVEQMARRAGQTAAQWIRSTITSHIRVDQAIHQTSLAKVADDETPYRTDKSNGTEP